ncbi:MFS transporter [Sulfurisphaera ohwakuensis]|uniref:MFS family permease n=1 Tax=Sulfurisphaera ohwakuensis TaxID=69656 RepID=A0A650CHV0_SULOH|nr:MFS transporter [Sulfurisphaera ohwakuensis]MBB5253624.1 MFS family permease [Sulfurisphaera ohwakuensis]QGR17359.1 MFS transporter [Sulfurisphaera ohwakuensis]
MTENRNSLILASIILVLMTVSARSVNNMVTTTVPLLGKYVLSLPDSIVGLLSTVMFAFTFLSTSYLNPRLNAQLRRKVFIASNVIIALSLILFSYSNVITIWIISALAGLVFGFIMPNLVTAASLTKDRRSAERLLSLYSTSLSLSLIIGPALESYLLTMFNYRQIFLWFLPLAILGTIISFNIKFPDVKREESGISVLKNKGLIASILSITTYNVPFAAFTTFLAILAKERFDLSNFEAYSVFLPFYIISFLTRLSMTIRPFRDLRMPLLVSILITIAGLIGILYAPSYSLFLVVIALLGIPHGSIFPMSTIMISRATRIEERNAVNSYFLAYNNILFLLVPAIVGFIAIFIGLTLAITLLVIPVVLSSILFFKMFWNDEITR